MGIVVGIDIGGSTTKIAGFREGKMLIPVQISADSAVASLFGAFGKFLYDNNLQLTDIGQVNLTGVGSSEIKQNIYGVPTYRVDEFSANGVGGGYFAGNKKEFMVVSMGTGTSFVEVRNNVPRHIGGIGIGGGTITGLSKLMLNTNDVDKIQELASGGKVGNIDLRIGDISKNPLPGLDLEITASNFGKASSRANCEDKAAGIVHMVIETICQTAVLISNGTDIRDFVLIGNLINFPECWNVCEMIKTMYPQVNFIIPENGEYGTAIGTALANECCLKHVE
ncbi:MAG: type II pantothenate kinase [Clostridiales bacterium]|nr:type II pantothenate kinase [Bacillota bacterium]MEE0517786.1 type II pantothenate kinase [Anaerovoracaceae bacterium]PWL95337.1 MAG: type II pantothenate kinase [Clostridiales bacterium]